MLATLCSYEERFGPCSLYTLRLAGLVAAEFGRIGDTIRARGLLEQVVRNAARAPGPGRQLRIDALIGLRELLLAEGETARAADVQRELAEECPLATEERDRFAAMLLSGRSESWIPAALN
jgi:hypothetical protein